MWVNCFPKAITNFAVVVIEHTPAGSRVRRANQRVTLPLKSWRDGVKTVKIYFHRGHLPQVNKDKLIK